MTASQEHQPTLDDVLAEITASAVKPDDLEFRRWIERYPQFKADIVDFMTGWIELESMKGGEITQEEVEGVVNRTMARFRQILDESDGFDVREESTGMTYRDAAIRVLEERGPLHYRELADAILQSGLMRPAGKTPAQSLFMTITVDIKRNGERSKFIRVRPGVFGLRGRHAASIQATSELADFGDGKDAGGEAEFKVHVPHFPDYSELRCLLRVWPGCPRQQVTGLQTTITRLRGTPDKSVNWTDPANWIPNRLEGGDRELARVIWNQGSGVNPGYTYGHWLLARRYNLVRDDSKGRLLLTEAGRDFLEQPGCGVESAIDEAEGLIKLLSIVADSGPIRTRELLREWGDYLSRRSNNRAEAAIRDTMRRRLNNLTARGLVEQKGRLYSATLDGVAYLQQNGDEESTADASQIWTLVRQQEDATRDSLREMLHSMDPFAFEHLVKRLLEEMGYQNVNVTAPSGDGGVDVFGDIEVGITSIREAVQVKRHRRPVQVGEVNALRGSLYRFNAVRGSIVTTSRFASGAARAAAEPGAAPITLVDGDKLIDLLIEYGIGVRKRTIELLEVDTESIAIIGIDD